MNRSRMLNSGFLSLFILQFILMTGSAAWAVPIAIVDSGTDLDHPVLSKKIWVNTKEIPNNGIDDDHNLYIDDIHGWNFADGDNQVFDYNLLGTFGRHVFRYFDVQEKMIEGRASKEDVAWMDSKKQERPFIHELGSFGHYAHGTHVAGIASRNSDQARIMAAKVLSTKMSISEALRSVTAELGSPMEDLMSVPSINSDRDNMRIESTLMKFVDKQAQMLRDVGHYLNSTEMKVANASFATTYPRVRGFVRYLGWQTFKRNLSDYEREKFIAYFFDNIMSKGSAFTEASQKTLFVISAGNDFLNNDIYPIYPANLKGQNIIRVAATRGYERLADFSNYGVETVEIAAPGVGIRSSVPGAETLAMSGTSMAAPFVSEIAGRVIDKNPGLTVAQVKKLLMQTVDLKDFLKDKVVSGGIANPDRALRAAEYSVTMNLDEAIEKARKDIQDVRVDVQMGGQHGFDGDPLPMYPPVMPVE